MFVTRKELSERWKKTVWFIADLPPEELPRIEIEGGKNRKTYLYRITDVEAYEVRHLCDGSIKEEK